MMIGDDAAHIIGKIPFLAKKIPDGLMFRAKNQQFGRETMNAGVVDQGMNFFILIGEKEGKSLPANVMQ